MATRNHPRCLSDVEHQSIDFLKTVWKAIGDLLIAQATAALEYLGPRKFGGDDGKSWLDGLKAAQRKKWLPVLEHANKHLNPKLEIAKFKMHVDELREVIDGRATIVISQAKMA